MKFKWIYIALMGFLLMNGVAAPQWQLAAPLNIPRAGATAVFYNNFIYVFGGKSSNNTILNSVERFDLQSQTWDTSSVPPFETPRFNAVAVVYENKIFLIGGEEDNEVLDNVEIYDPQTNRWEDGEDLRNAREGHSAVVFDGKLYVIGGTKGGFSYLDEIEWFDSSTNKWEQSTWQMISPRAGQFATVAADTFYMFGGVYFNPLINNYKCTTSFDWIPITDWSVPRWYGATTLLGDSIFLMGGKLMKLNQQQTTEEVKIYNLRTKKFEDGPPLPQPVSGATAVTVADQIFLIGGFDSRDQPTAAVYSLSKTITAIGEDEPPPPVANNFALLKGFPNPFNGRITLQIILNYGTHVQLKIYDLQGRLVKNLFSGYLSRGEHRIYWQAQNGLHNTVASGLYIAILKTPENIKRLKLFYAK